MNNITGRGGILIIAGIIVLVTTGIFAEKLHQVNKKVETPTIILEADMPKEIIAHSGLASWYDYDLPGIPGYSARSFTVASRDWPKGTCLRVSNLDNNKVIHARVNDYVNNYGVIIDLSSLAFSKLANLKIGLIKVEVRPTSMVFCRAI